MMRGISLARLVAGVAVGLTLACVAAPVTAQIADSQPNWKPEGAVPRAPDGKPDLSGVWWLGREPGLVDGRVGSPRTG